jgi:hypothetical protein
MNTTPYFTNPNAMRSLGKRLFKVAVDLSQEYRATKKQIAEMVRAAKGRKNIPIKVAVEEIHQLHADIRKARVHRRFRKAGKTPVKTCFWRGRLSLAPADTHLYYYSHAIVPPLAERLDKYKRERRRKLADRVGGGFTRGSRDRHHLEFTYTDDPSQVTFQGTRSQHAHSWNWRWIETHSHWKVVLPHDWNARVLPMHLHLQREMGYSQIALLDHKKIYSGEVKSAHYRRAIRGAGVRVWEEHYAAKVAKQGRGFRITTEDGIIVRRVYAAAHRGTSLTYGADLREAVTKANNKCPLMQEYRRNQQALRTHDLLEALETLKLVQSGHRSVHNLTAAEKLDLMRVVQDQIATAQKRTATFGGIGQRAIHAEPHCAAA